MRFSALNVGSNFVSDFEDFTTLNRGMPKDPESAAANARSKQSPVDDSKR